MGVADEEGFSLWRVPHFLLKTKIIDPYERSILLYLATYKKGQCYPSEKKISDELGISMSSVKRKLKTLIRQGFLRCKTGGSKSGEKKENSQYEVILRPDWVLTDPSDWCLREPSRGKKRSTGVSENLVTGVSENPGLVSERATNINKLILSNINGENLEGLAPLNGPAPIREKTRQEKYADLPEGMLRMLSKKDRDAELERRKLQKQRMTDENAYM